MIETILFDLDGTILDTNELIIQSFIHVFQDVPDPPLPLDREYISRNMGRPLTEQLRLFSGLEEVEHLAGKYREFNVSKHNELVKQFPHVAEVIDELGRRGIRMGIVTSKTRKTTLMGLKLSGLEPAMETIVTVDDVTRAKPDPEPVLKAMDALGARAETTLMVGDSQYDLEAAAAAGVRSAAVAWSLKGEDFLRTFNPDYVIRDMRELLAIVEEAGINK